ncbi:putative membrane protein [Emiliania huxleyi virus 164]|nr:putative membrane protein [Emiliania huxleyi virus 164]
MPEFSSAFTEFEEVSNPDVIGAMTSAILAYRYECNRAANAFSLLKSNTPGASIPPHGTGKYGSVLDSTDEPILSSLALERPGDQSKLALAKGALESGIHLIKTNNADDKYVLSLYTYAKQNENLVSDLFHEQMRVDMSMKIGAIVKNAVLDDDVRNDMINILKQFIKDRSDSFSSTGFLSYQNSWVDEIAHTFDGQAMSNIPLMDIMVAINTGNLNLYKRGLSRLFQQYTSYINWHKNTIRNVLVQLPPDQKFYAMYQTPGQQAVDTLINYYLYPLFEYGKATLIAGRDSPISEYVGWKNAMTHYPYLTLLASFGSGGTLTKIRDKLPGANLLGGTLKVATSMAMGGGFGASALGLLI